MKAAALDRSKRSVTPAQLETNVRYNLRNRGPANFEQFAGNECPICLESYVSPVIVNCSHAFCGRCVTKCQQTGMFQQCPICKMLLLKELFIYDVSFTKRLQVQSRRKSSTQTPKITKKNSSRKSMH